MCVARLWVKGKNNVTLFIQHEQCVVQKARVIVDGNSHVLAKYYELLPSGRRFRVLKSNTASSISVAFLNR